jgi:hypothetical protein
MKHGHQIEKTPSSQAYQATTSRLQGSMRMQLTQRADTGSLLPSEVARNQPLMFSLDSVADERNC